MLSKMTDLSKLSDVVGERIIIRPLKVSDVSQRYVDWLNDPEVNRFLDIRGISQNMEMVKNYVLSHQGAINRLLLGIFDSSSKLHIGNVTFSSIDLINNAAYIGIAIGDKVYWGKGYATEALLLAINLAFHKLKLHRLEAGVSIKNLPSQKLFEKVGFKKEGILKERGKFGDIYVDGLIYGLVNEEA